MESRYWHHPEQFVVKCTSTYVLNLILSEYMNVFTFNIQVNRYLIIFHLKKIDFMIFISSRYIYIIAATSDTNFGRLAKWLTLNSNFHIYLTVLGLTMTAFHGISTIFLASDQFFFDQGKRKYFDQKRFCTEMYEKIFWVKILVQKLNT